jgi:hypothetical protein
MRVADDSQRRLMFSRTDVAIHLIVLPCPRATHMARTRRLVIDNSISIPNKTLHNHMQNRREHPTLLHVIVDNPATLQSNTAYTNRRVVPDLSTLTALHANPDGLRALTASP